MGFFSLTVRGNTPYLDKSILAKSFAKFSQNKKCTMGFCPKRASHPNDSRKLVFSPQVDCNALSSGTETQGDHLPTILGSQKGFHGCHPSTVVTKVATKPTTMTAVTHLPAVGELKGKDLQ